MVTAAVPVPAPGPVAVARPVAMAGAVRAPHAVYDWTMRREVNPESGV